MSYPKDPFMGQEVESTRWQQWPTGQELPAGATGWHTGQTMGPWDEQLHRVNWDQFPGQELWSPSGFIKPGKGPR